jgi:hypothetical protein
MLLILLFPALLFLAAVVEAFGNLNVPILSPQPLLYMGGMAILGVLTAVPAGLVYGLRPFGRRNDPIVALLVAGSFLLAVDVTFQGHRLLASLPGGSLPAVLDFEIGRPSDLIRAGAGYAWDKCSN